MHSKKMVSLACIVLLMFFGTTLAAQENSREAPVKERLRKALQIRQEMREIEQSAIDSDPELKAAEENIKALHRRLREQLRQKLENNAHYQDLHIQLQEMRKEWAENKENAYKMERRANQRMKQAR